MDKMMINQTANTEKPNKISKINFQKQLYYRDNLYNTNNLVSIVLFSSAIVGFIFALCTKIQLFNIKYKYCFLISIVSIIFGIIQLALNKIARIRNIVKYIGLIFSSVVVALITSTPGVGLSIFICFAIIPFMSTLYLSRTTSIITSVACYIVMIIALYIKSHNYNLIPNDPESALVWFSVEAIGYSLSYFFVFLFTLFISSSFKRTLLREYEKQQELKDLKQELINSFANIVEWSDKYTGEHIKRTCIYVNLIANKLVEMGYYEDVLTKKTIKLYSSAAALHDIGKINVPNNVLSKPGKFTEEEYELMKTHSQTGYDIITTDLSNLEDPEYIKIASEMALYHHEKWDGTGYPKKIKGTEIPLCSRIMAAADVLDALLSKRQYKDSYDIDKTFNIISEEKGKQFEPCIADAVFELKDKIIAVISE